MRVQFNKAIGHCWRCTVQGYHHGSNVLPDLGCDLTLNQPIGDFALVEGDGSINQAFHVQLKQASAFRPRISGVRRRCRSNGQKVAKAVTISVVDALDAKAPVSFKGKAAPYWSAAWRYSLARSDEWNVLFSVQTSMLLPLQH